MHVRRRSPAVLRLLAVALCLSLAAGDPEDPVATDACGAPDTSVPDPDRVPTPAGESMPSLDVCSLHLDTRFHPKTGVLEEVVLTLTLAGDVADRPDGATYVAGWTGPNGDRTCYHVLVWTSHVAPTGAPTTRVGGSCPTGELPPGSFEFLDGNLPAEAVTLDGREVRFRVVLEDADPVLRATLRAGATLHRPAGLTYVNTGVPRQSPVDMVWDSTTTTRDVTLAP